MYLWRILSVLELLSTSAFSSCVPTKMAGRPGVISREKYQKIFDSYREKIVINEKVIAPSAKIWQSLSTHVVKNSNPKSIYTAALRWWKNIVDNESSDNDIESDENSQNISLETIDGQTDVNNSTLSNCISSRINFNIYISADVWAQISPIPQKYYRKKDRHHTGKSRNYLVLKPGVWTNILIDKIAEHRKNIICNWGFKRNKVSVSGKYFVVVTATCVNCCATLTGFVKEEPKHRDDRVKFCFTVKNFDESRHEGTTKTVRNTGSRANEIFSSTKSGLYLRQKMAGENMTMFEKPKGRQFTLNAIKCGKHRRKAVNKLSSCPYTALTYIQAMNCYANTVHGIGMSPFGVIYVSPEQIKLFKAYKAKNRYTRIQCDASGNLAHKLERPNGTLSRHIFLYSFVISDDFQVSVHSSLSERNDMSFIKHWMDEWLRLGGSIPNEFIADMSAALLGAAVIIFGRQSSMITYTNTLFTLLNGGNGEKPSCFVRIDIAHFIKKIASCDALKTQRLKHKDFLVRSVVLMIKMNDLRTARQHLLEVLVVAMSTTEGYTENGDETPCEQYKRSLIRKIKGINETAEENSLVLETINQPEEVLLTEAEVILNLSHDQLIDHMDSHVSSFSTFINDIEREAKELVTSNDNGDRDNLMYNPSFAVYLRKIAKLMLMWSAICCPLFDSPHETSSSANVECDFKNVKSALRHIIPCNVDVFIQNHLEMLDGAIKIASQKYFKVIGTVDSDIDEQSDHEPSRSSDDNLMTGNDISTQVLGESTEHSCVACNNNDIPGGAHKCVRCGKNVHILPGCSVSIGQDEGYGEMRVCIDCSKSPSSNENTSETQNKTIPNRQSEKPSKGQDGKSSKKPSSSKPQFAQSSGVDTHLNGEFKKSVRAAKSSKISRSHGAESIIHDELNHKEQWSKKKIKRSVYLKPSPHWDLVTNVNKKVKIGFLSNGNLSTTIHRVNKIPVSAINTCSFDSIVQILAAAYAYIESYRETCEKSEDGIFEIAILLAQNANLKRINNLRVTLLYNLFGQKSFEMVSTNMVNKLLSKTPSYEEHSHCPKCKYSQKRACPIAGVRTNIYSDDMKKLQEAVEANFPADILCKCGQTLKSKRSFGKHFFIELPSCGNKTVSMFEESAVFKIKDVPLVLHISNEEYVLFGLVIFKPPIFESDIGHYTSAIRINNKWEMYDDMRSKPYTISSNESAVIHCLFYVQTAIETSIHSPAVAQECPNSHNGTSNRKTAANDDGNCFNEGHDNEECSNSNNGTSNRNTSANNDENCFNEGHDNDGDISDDNVEEFIGFAHSESSLYRLYHGHDKSHSFGITE